MYDKAIKFFLKLAWPAAALCWLACACVSPQVARPYNADRDNPEARIGATAKADAVAYLNRVRANPRAFSREIGVNLSEIEARPPLKWNATLAKIAQAKAEDMLRRGYFDHVDPDGNGTNIKLMEAGYPLPERWTEPRSSTSFESLAYFSANYHARRTAIDAIKGLIEDRGVNPPGHRYHLLGVGKFRDRHTEIGIGIAEGWRGGRYEFYCAVFVAHPVE